MFKMSEKKSPTSLEFLLERDGHAKDGRSSGKSCGTNNQSNERHLVGMCWRMENPR